MIVSKNFIWLHFPKCSGTETERLLKANADRDPSMIFDKIDPREVVWHQSIAERHAVDPSFDVQGRDIICNIRRLPSWILSRVHYEYARSPHLKITRTMLLAGEFFEASGYRSKADQYVRRYNTPAVTHWIRTEYLAADFERVFSRYLALSGVDIASQVKRTNATKLQYIPEIEFHFTERDLEILYTANPIWASVERAAYGDIYKIT